MRHIVLSSVAVFALSFSVIGCGSSSSTTKKVVDMGKKTDKPSDTKSQSADKKFSIDNDTKLITGLNGDFSYTILTNKNIFEILDDAKYTDGNGHQIKVLSFKETPAVGTYSVKIKISSGETSVEKIYEVSVEGESTTDDGGSDDSGSGGTVVKTLTFSMPTQDKLMQADAVAQCTSPSFLPTIAQLEKYKSKVWDIVKDIDSDNNASTPFNSVVWASDETGDNQGFWFKGGSLLNAKPIPRTERSYVVCATESDETVDNNSTTGDGGDGDTDTTQPPVDKVVTIDTTKWLKVTPDDKKSWADADAYCKSIGWELPSVDDFDGALIDVNGETFTRKLNDVTDFSDYNYMWASGNNGSLADIIFANIGSAVQDKVSSYGMDKNTGNYTCIKK